MTEQKREFTGVWIPKEVLDHSELTPLQKIMYADIASFSQCFMLNKTLATRYGISETSVSKNISKLVQCGLIHINAFDGRKRYMTALHISSMQGLTKVHDSLERNDKAGYPLSSNIDNKLDNKLDNTIDIAISKNRDMTTNESTSIVKPPKPRDLIWDAVTEAFGLSKAEITRSLASQLGKVVKDLKDVNATPEEIFKRYRNYKVLHPDWELTPFALVKHWAAITDSHVEKLLDITRKSRDREIDTYTEDQMLTDIVQKAYDENQAKQLEEKRRRETKRVLETEQAMRILEEGRK